MEYKYHIKYPNAGEDEGHVKAHSVYGAFAEVENLDDEYLEAGCLVKIIQQKNPASWRFFYGQLQKTGEIKSIDFDTYQLLNLKIETNSDNPFIAQVARDRLAEAERRKQ